jgi:membrane-bound serine protease (ClpP class)
VALEILVLPGFGVAGILGVVCILVSLVLAMVKNEPSGPLDMHALLNGIITTLLGGLGAGVGVAVLGRVMLKNRFVARIGLIHGTEIAATSEGDAGTAGRGESKAQWPIGAVGAAETMLRPAGKARIEGKLLDVVAESEVIPAGTPVIVVKKVGPMTVVRVHKRAGGANGNE